MGWVPLYFFEGVPHSPILWRTGGEGGKRAILQRILWRIALLPNSPENSPAILQQFSSNSPMLENVLQQFSSVLQQFSSVLQQFSSAGEFGESLENHWRIAGESLENRYPV
jgi:hypothetical protein